MKLIIVEGFQDKEELTPDMKYYAFDWDDNLMYMPTKIILKDNNGKILNTKVKILSDLRKTHLEILE